MAKITGRWLLAPDIYRMELAAPRIARKRKAGQFVIIRVHERGERIPLTIVDSDSEKGTVSIVVQAIGKGTVELCNLKEGEEVLDLVGPLGTPTHVEKFGTVVCIGGGVGVGPVYPIACAMKEAGNSVISIISAREADLLILEDDMRSVSEELLIATDDGSKGHHGFPTQVLQQLIDDNRHIDAVVAIGPVPLMHAVCEVTRPYNIKTIVSLNPIMVDGTGMCGGCRVSVGGETKFVCVDGPEFDGHQVDFQLLARRLKTYEKEEAILHKKCYSNPNLNESDKKKKNDKE